MNINEIISKFDALRENQISTEHKTDIIEALDKRVENELIDCHYPNTGESRNEGELLIPDEYFMCYIYYLSYMIDFDIGEIDRSVNEKTLFELEYSKFERYYQSTHIPKGVSEIIV